MNKFLLLFIFFLITISFYPLNAEANPSCVKEGHTVIFVNGILNTEEEARGSLKELVDSFNEFPTQNNNTTFELGYNPSRYAGAGDTIQSIAQALLTSTSNFDRDTILMQIHPKINTQKILLVGHSQGTFYTNEIYEYLIKNGLPKESVAIYNIATPASMVADTEIPADGDYLTSTNDNLIWEVRGWTEFFEIPLPLEPNFMIPVQDLNKPNLWKGHSFSGEYLAGAPARIIRDIDKALSSLKANQALQNVETGCYNPPQNNLSYKAKETFFAVTDPVVTPVLASTVTGATNLYKTGAVVTEAYGKGLAMASDALGGPLQKTTPVINSIKEFVSRTIFYFSNSNKRVVKNQEGAVLFAVQDTPEPTPESTPEPTPEPSPTLSPPPPPPVPSPVLRTPESTPLPSIGSSSLPEPEKVAETTVDSTQSSGVSSDNSSTEIILRGGGGHGAIIADSTAPNKPVVITPSSFTSAFSTTTITFIGTVESGATISTDYSDITTTSSDGNWSLTLTFPQGGTVLTFYATDSSGNRGSYGTEISLQVDSSIEPPVITTPSSFSSAFSSSGITFVGTSESGSLISTDYSSATTTTAGDGTWTLALSNFPEGSSAVNFYATKDGFTSRATLVNLSVDTVIPTVSSFVVLECQYSLSSSLCLSGTETINLRYSANSTSPITYSIYSDGVFQKTTTDSNTTLSISDGLSSDIVVVARDDAGNTSTSSAVTVNISKLPLIINEIAWAGTQDDPTDEWIEIYNRTGIMLDLTNVKLVSSDGSIEITFSGNIDSRGTSGSGYGHYLIERNDSNTTSVIENKTDSFSGVGLSDTHNRLSLVHYLGGLATSTLDSTPSSSSCGGSWCAGLASTSPLSMERINPMISGALSTNWATNDGVMRNGTDSGGNSINGTPGATNSSTLNANIIGYYCQPHLASYLSGNYYEVPTGSPCLWISNSISGKKHGYVFKGTVGSATVISGHFLNTVPDKSESLDNFAGSGLVQGDDLFVAIFEARTGPAYDDLNFFLDYFTGLSTTPPHSNYGILEWKVGQAP